MASVKLDRGGKDKEEVGGVPASVVASILHFPPSFPHAQHCLCERSGSPDTEAKMGIHVQVIYEGNALRGNL